MTYIYYCASLLQTYLPYPPVFVIDGDRGGTVVKVLCYKSDGVIGIFH